MTAAQSRRFAALVSIAMLAAVLEPLVRDPHEDSFPLSTYPMFATKRPTSLTFHYALGQGKGGERVTLKPRLIGSGEVLQAMQVLDRAVSKGRGEMENLCRAIAARVAADAEYDSVIAIRIVTGTHDALDYLGAGTLGRETERLRCPVERGRGGGT